MLKKILKNLQMHHLLKNELNNDDPGVQSEIFIFNPLTCKNEQWWAGNRVRTQGLKVVTRFSNARSKGNKGEEGWEPPHTERPSRYKKDDSRQPRVGRQTRILPRRFTEIRYPRNPRK